MSFVARHLDNVRDKPHHVRRQVAFLASGAITGVIALAWLSLSLYAGTFALRGSNFAQMTGAEPAAGASGGVAPASAGVAGVAAAAEVTPAASGVDVVPQGGESAPEAAQSDPASAGPVDPTEPASTPGSGQTIIPF